jgi:hypothetical protein
MTTVFINIPKYHPKHGPEWLSFEDVLTSGVAIGFIFSEAEAVSLSPGCGIVLLSNDGERRAEGKISKPLEKEEKALNGKQRYNVYFEDANEVFPYKYQRVGRNGVTII